MGQTKDLKTAEWPGDAPFKGEDSVISIICGNTHLHWAVHAGHDASFAPILFWRTPPLHTDERQDDPCGVLARHLPKQAHAIIFGEEGAPHGKDVAAEVAAARRHSALSIYVVSTNAEHESAINFLFKDINTRIFKLNAPHFFSKQEGAYDSIGVDRVSALYACKYSYKGRPVLVFDAGTAWTYTAMDQHGKIIGGGISPGVGARFRSLSDYCGNLPVIEHSKYHEALVKNLENKKPFEIFATNTEDAMMTSVFSEIANQCRCLVKHFLERVKDANGEYGKPVIAIAGGDAPFFQKVLQKDFSNLVSCEAGTEMPVDSFEVQEMKHLVHYGIGHLLNSNIAPKPDNPDDVLRALMNGQRVAKEFSIEDSDSDHIYRGSIVNIKTGETLDDDLFAIRYDDGDREQLDLTEAYDAFKLYMKVGEKDKNKESLRLDQIKKSIEDMATTVPTLASEEEERAKARDEALKRREAMNEKRKQAQATKRSRTALKTPAGKKRKTKEHANRAAALYLNKRIAKAFEGDDGESDIYFGTIDKLPTEGNMTFYWHVTYDDDDEEEFDEKDIVKALKLYGKHREDDPKAKEVAAAVASKSYGTEQKSSEGGEAVMENEVNGDIMDVDKSNEGGDKKTDTDALTAEAATS